MGPLHPQAVTGLQLLAAGDYFGAHEALESAWKEEANPIRGLYQGVLQVAVGYYHLSRGNYPGALKMFARSSSWLAPFPEVCQGIAVGQLRRDVQTLVAELNRLGPTRLSLLDSRLLKPATWNKV